MLYRATTPISHNGKYYAEGDLLPDMKEKQLTQLIQSNAVKAEPELEKSKALQMPMVNTVKPNSSPKGKGSK